MELEYPLGTWQAPEVIPHPTHHHPLRHAAPRKVPIVAEGSMQCPCMWHDPSMAIKILTPGWTRYTGHAPKNAAVIPLKRRPCRTPGTRDCSSAPATQGCGRGPS